MPGGSPALSIEVSASQVEVNPDLAPAAFRLDAPRGATPMTIEQLRAAGPLGGK